MTMIGMNDQMRKQAEQLMKAAQDVAVPENLQAMAQQGVARTREAYAKAATAAKDNAKVLETVAAEAQVGARAISDKFLANFADNTEAAFDAAEAIARAKSLPEAAKMHADFVQSQLTAYGKQTKDLLELSGKVTKQTFESLSAAAMAQTQPRAKARKSA
jgi:hypothetical protein